MNRANQEMRALAAKLINCEEGKLKVSRREHSTVFIVPEKLRPHLATLMGNDGCRALVMRSLALASHEVPWLYSVRVSIDGVLEEAEETDPVVTGAERSEGAEVLAARLLGLLAVFIGEKLTLRLVCEVWSEISSSDLNLSGVKNNEKKT